MIVHVTLIFLPLNFLLEIIFVSTKLIFVFTLLIYSLKNNNFY